MRYRCALFFPGIPVVKSLAWWFRIPFWQRVMGAFVLGALVGWRRASVRGGDRLDHWQYAAVHGIALTLAAVALTVLAGRLGIE